MNHPVQHRPSAQRTTAMTESPWFWLLLFSATAWLALQLAAPKYSHRQLQLEHQFQGRQWAHLESPEDGPRKQDVIRFSTADHLVVRLRPLRWAALTGVVVAVVGLVCQRRLFSRQANSGNTTDDLVA